MGPLFRLVGEICDKEEKGNPLFLFFATNLIHKRTGRLLTFYVITKG